MFDGVFPDINECLSSPCQNGAVCKDERNQFICECTSGFAGVYCETGEALGTEDCKRGSDLNGVIGLGGIKG